MSYVMRPLLRYVPEERAIAEFIGQAEIPSGYGLAYDAIELLLAPGRMLAQRAQWAFPGGQMEIRTPAGPPTVVPLSAPDWLERSLGPDGLAVVHEGQRAAWRATVADRASWSAERWVDTHFALFAPRRATGRESQVPKADADFFDLEADSRYPHRTLRLGRVADQIIDDHGVHWMATERKLEALETLDAATAEGASRIEQQFGPEARAVAVWFAQDRGARFVGA